MVLERVGKIHWSFIYNRMTVASQNTVRSPHFGKLLISAFFFLVVGMSQGQIYGDLVFAFITARE